MRLDGLLSSRCRTASYIRFDFDLETKLGTEVFRNLDLPDFWIFSRRPFEEWWSVSGSNRRPQACKASALPTELTPRSPLARRLAFEELVGLGRFELPTSRLSSARSNQLSYKPNACSLGRLSAPKRAIQKKKEKRRRRSPAKCQSLDRLMFPMMFDSEEDLR